MQPFSRVILLIICSFFAILVFSAGTSRSDPVCTNYTTPGPKTGCGAGVPLSCSGYNDAFCEASGDCVANWFFPLNVSQSCSGPHVISAQCGTSTDMVVCFWYVGCEWNSNNNECVSTGVQCETGKTHYAQQFSCVPEFAGRTQRQSRGFCVATRQVCSVRARCYESTGTGSGGTS